MIDSTYSGADLPKHTSCPDVMRTSSLTNGDGGKRTQDRPARWGGSPILPRWRRTSKAVNVSDTLSYVFFLLFESVSLT